MVAGAKSVDGLFVAKGEGGRVREASCSRLLGVVA